MSDVAAPAPVRRRRRVLRVFVYGLIIVALLIAVALFGWQWWSVERFRESTDNAYIRSEITPISSKIQGYVEAVLVTDNQHVDKGATLIVIQAEEYEARIDQARAELATSRTELEILASRRALQPSVIAQAEAEQTFAEAELTRAEQALERSESLIEGGITTRDRYDDAVADARKARAAKRMAAAGLATALKEPLIIDAEKLQLEVTIKEREVAIAWAEM